MAGDKDGSTDHVSEVVFLVLGDAGLEETAGVEVLEIAQIVVES